MNESFDMAFYLSDVVQIASDLLIYTFYVLITFESHFMTVDSEFYLKIYCVRIVTLI